MTNLLFQNTDTIPFVPKDDFIANIDSILANDFLPFQHLYAYSSRLCYETTDTVIRKVAISGIEGVARPFMHQVGGVLFLIFAVLFILFALVFSKNGLSQFAGIKSVFSFDSRNNKLDNEPITTIDAWSKLFYAFQTFAIYSILFFDIAIQNPSQHFGSRNYLILFTQIFIGIILFVLIKYFLYSIMAGVFSKSKMSAFIKTYNGVIYLTGVLSFLPIVAYIYITEVRVYVLFFLLAVFIVGRIAVFLQSFIFFAKAHIGGFYFFVYLCGIEIMPYFLLYKAIVLIN